MVSYLNLNGVVMATDESDSLAPGDFSTKQSIRAKQPFDPINLNNFRGRNYSRCVDSMKSYKWTDPRFITEDQAKENGWSIPKDALSVTLKHQDRTKPEFGGPFRVFNASVVLGMPTLASLLEADKAAITKSVVGPVLASAKVVAPAIDVGMKKIAEVAKEPAPMLEDVISITPTRAQQVENIVDEIGTSEYQKQQALDVIGQPAQVNVTVDQIGTKAEVNTLDITNDATEEQEGFAFLAPYMLNGLHNFEGLALAEKLNKLAKEKKLTESKEKLDYLLGTDSKAKSLGLKVVETSVYLGDPELRRDRSNPRSLLAGELVRDKDGMYHPAGGGRPVVHDKGEAIVVKSKTQHAFAGALELAMAKGWNTIEITGKKSMVAEAWLEAQLRGINVVNFEPSEKDKEKLVERLAQVEAERRERETKELAAAKALEEQQAKEHGVADVGGGSVAPDTDDQEKDQTLVITPGALEQTPERVEQREVSVAPGEKKMASITYRVCYQRDAQSSPIERRCDSAKEAAKAFGRLDASSNPVVIRTVTRLDGEVDEDVVQGTVLGKPLKANKAIHAALPVVDREFDEAMDMEMAADREHGPVINKGTQSGKILNVNGDRFSQSRGGGSTEVIWHDAANFPKGFKPEIGKVMDISYRNGLGTAKDMSRARERENDDTGVSR